ncbi:fas apoptotic inhibitory molecule 1 isoform X2 [Ixodes scapularis]|uniref:fas apoptotic inhibitory molecule 1 isoform X2 n=1 Tax=Ixodes scapularis TaxID=6945 RepID=UPI001A9EDB81|nr:fas apoptotic inhibitory molecule 1 isoform X2 [Ixodes scapularis]
MSAVSAVWEVPLSDKIHKIEFEHGTTTGKRVVKVDGKEIVRRDWMFKLVGSEPFEVGNAKCLIVIRAVSGFTYEYSLVVNGKHLDVFRERQSKILNTWVIEDLEEPTRVVLEKETLDVYVNGTKVEVVSEFVEGGTEMHFQCPVTVLVLFLSARLW